MPLYPHVDPEDGSEWEDGDDTTKAPLSKSIIVAADPKAKEADPLDPEFPVIIGYYSNSHKKDRFYVGVTTKLIPAFSDDADEALVINGVDYLRLAVSACKENGYNAVKALPAFDPPAGAVPAP